MKNIIRRLLIFSCLLAAAPLAHAEPGIITVYGSLTKTNDSICPLRAFQYYVSGDYRTPKGVIVNFGSCLENVSIPLSESLDQPVTPSQRDDVSVAVNRVIDAESILAKNTDRTLKMRFIVKDTDEIINNGLGTLLSIEENKEKK